MSDLTGIATPDRAAAMAVMKVGMFRSKPDEPPVTAPGIIFGTSAPPTSPIAFATWCLSPEQSLHAARWQPHRPAAIDCADAEGRQHADAAAARPFLDVRNTIRKSEWSTHGCAVLRSRRAHCRVGELLSQTSDRCARRAGDREGRVGRPRAAARGRAQRGRRPSCRRVPQCGPGPDRQRDRQDDAVLRDIWCGTTDPSRAAAFVLHMRQVPLSIVSGRCGMRCVSPLSMPFRSRRGFRRVPRDTSRRSRKSTSRTPIIRFD